MNNCIQIQITNGFRLLFKHCINPIYRLPSLLLQVREVSPNGPHKPPEPSPNETHKTFVREMKHPILRPGYVPIPVFHEGAELRQQQHPCYSYIQPSTAQKIHTEGQCPSPTGLHCRPRSPLHGPSDSYSTEPGKASSPVSTEVRLEAARRKHFTCEETISECIHMY